VFWVGRRLSNESREKKEAKAYYLKLRAQGKTHDARRLAKIRAEREAAQARRTAETAGKQSALVGMGIDGADFGQRKQRRLKLARKTKRGDAQY
jgi:hypothetical protein